MQRHITSGNDKRSPYSLQVVAGYGAKLYIPRHFRGLLTLTSSRNLPVNLLGELGRNAVLFTDNNSSRIYFVGDLPKSSDHEGTWQGDEITVEAVFGVEVSFVDEPPPEQVPQPECRCC
jgi:hypothetical protein